MRENDLNSLRARLSKQIDDIIRDCLLSGQTDVETVHGLVKKKVSMRTFYPLILELANKHVRNIIQRRLKYTAVPPAEIITNQQQLELAAMDEFRGIPDSISYEETPGHVVYVPYRETLEWQRVAALALLDGNIRDVQHSRQRLAAGNRFATLLVAHYGDLALSQLLDKWNAEGKPALGQAAS